KVESRNPGDTSRITHHTARYPLLAALLWGLQLLVQHIQPSIMTAVVVGAYVLFVLRPMRPRIVWAFVAATVGGALLAAVQFLPAYYLFAESGRGTASYHLFLENSWLPSSA